MKIIQNDTRSKWPIPAVLSVVVDDGRILLVQRANPPDAGLWGFPGGKIEFGESLFDAAERELFEETGISGKATDVLTATSALDFSDMKELRQHFVLVAIYCEHLGGKLQAADDALSTDWFAFDQMSQMKHGVSIDVLEVAALGLRRNRMGRPSSDILDANAGYSPWDATPCDLTISPEEQLE